MISWGWVVVAFGDGRDLVICGDCECSGWVWGVCCGFRFCVVWCSIAACVWFGSASGLVCWCLASGSCLSVVDSVRRSCGAVCGYVCFVANGVAGWVFDFNAGALRALGLLATLGWWV